MIPPLYVAECLLLRLAGAMRARPFGLIGAPPFSVATHRRGNEGTVALLMSTPLPEGCYPSQER